mgnify:CR=1 FL=1
MEVKISVNKDNQISKGIIYIGQYGTSGYASAAKGYLCYFYMHGIPISWEPLRFDSSDLNGDNYYNLIVKSLIDKKLEFCDTVILHSTPDLWNSMLNQNQDRFEGKRLIGYTVWETSKLPESWVGYMNNSVHQIWCPSTYNKKVFEDSGVKPEVRVIPHIFLNQELLGRDRVELRTSTGELVVNTGEYTFYNISELNARKGVDDLIRAYCGAFTVDDKVRLILKVHYRDYSDKNKKYCINEITKITRRFPNPPKIMYILDNLGDNGIMALHSIGDCYATLCKSEGFGLTIFDAFNYGKRIIATGYSGYVDFLGNDYPGLVKYKMGNVEGMEEFSKNYTEDQEWAIPNIEHAKELMRAQVDDKL